MKAIKNGIELSLSEDIKETIQFYSEGTIRCTKSKMPLRASLVVKYSPKEINFSKSENEKSIILSTEKVKAIISKSDGKISFCKPDSTPLLEEYEKPEFEKIVVKGDEGYSIKQKFLLNSEGLYGLGQNQENYMNYKNKKILLSQTNTNAISPVLISSNNIGIFWDNYSATIFSEKDNISEFYSKMGDGIDYYLFVGDNLDKVISEYRKLTGKAVMLPRWAFGYWQSKERYQTQDELLSVGQKYRQLQIPIDVMVQDWEWWERGKWSGMEFDKTRFYDPKKMMDELHKINLHALISVWPSIGVESAMHDDLDKRGFLLKPISWGNSRYVDVYNPEAMDIYNEYVYRNIYTQGFDGWWHDSTEPDVVNSLTKESHQYETERLDNNYLGSYTRYLNPFVLAMLDKIYEKWTSAGKEKRACILTRSAFAGIQRDGVITWSGDIGASWEIFKDQITAAINFCISGFPYWSFDIGAFFIGAYGGIFSYGAKNPAYMEFYTRMFQFAAFCPIFRSHGTNAPREMWEMGEFMPVLVEFDKLRYKLIPYIYSLAGRVYIEDYTMMRSLVMDFPNDKNVYEIKDEYMFGNNILVAPVTDYMYHTPPQISKLVPKEVFKNGVKVKYYKDNNFTNLTKEETADNINIIWYTGRPDYVTDSEYSIRWEGTLVAPETGKYQFQVKTHDSKVIILDGKKLNIELDYIEPYFEYINLEKGKEYSIICETQRMQTGPARFLLFWKTPSDFQKEMEKADKPKTREVYLPKGCKWIDFWTNAVYEGGKTYTFDAPIDKIPLLIKQGSILPLKDNMQYADEKPFGELEIRVYQGANGEFLLYEDEGDNLNYQSGSFSLIKFEYNENEKKLKINKREGTFEGMQKDRIFKITNGKKTIKTINYNGEELVVIL
jgi:alpha-D-xyloside xylohydrolase